MKEALFGSCVIIAGLLLAQPAPDRDEAHPKPVVVTEEVIVTEMSELGSYWPAKIPSVVDGDPVDVEVKKTIRIRLNVWCPETHGVQKEAGLRAKFYLKKFAEGKSGVVIIPWKDSLKDELTLDRVLGRVVINGTDVGREMIRKKLGAATKAELQEMYPEK